MGTRCDVCAGTQQRYCIMGCVGGKLGAQVGVLGEGDRTNAYKSKGVLNSKGEVVKGVLKKRSRGPKEPRKRVRFLLPAEQVRKRRLQKEAELAKKMEQEKREAKLRSILQGKDGATASGGSSNRSTGSRGSGIYKAQGASSLDQYLSDKSGRSSRSSSRKRSSKSSSARSAGSRSAGSSDDTESTYRGRPHSNRSAGSESRRRKRSQSPGRGSAGASRGSRSASQSPSQRPGVDRGAASFGLEPMPRSGRKKARSRFSSSEDEGPTIARTKSSPDVVMNLNRRTRLR